MTMTAEDAARALESVPYPGLDGTLVGLNRVRDVAVDGGAIALTIELASPLESAAVRDAIGRSVREALLAAGANDVRLAFRSRVTTRSIQGDDPCPGVANIVLVMSGKGGVGKSTVATNLTLALARAGARVGLLDADMYGPSIPTMLGVMGRPGSADGQKFLPLERFGVKLMSLGFLLDDAKTAVVWRGPMLQGALLQFLKDVEWGTLDYLVLDLPPGTGDIALTISQKLRCTGAVVVTTPQEVALQDVYKSVSMAQKVGIPLLGVVENESYFVCDGCSKRHELFGAGGGAKVAEFAGAPLLGQVPLDVTVREWGDAGTPVVQAAPESPVARSFAAIAEALAARITGHNLTRPDALRIDRSGGTNRHLPVAR